MNRLEQWQEKATLGIALRQEEARFIQTYRHKIFARGQGWVVGPLPAPGLEKQLRVWFSLPADLIARPEALPLSADSQDWLLAYHTLEFTSNKLGALKEMCRVLRPSGHLLLLSFNPPLFWGRNPKWQGKKVVNRRGCFYPTELKRVLHDNGLTPVEGQFLFYPSPLPWSKPSISWNQVGHRWWPHGAWVNALVAQKQLLIPIKARSQEKRIKIGKLALSPLSLQGGIKNKERNNGALGENLQRQSKGSLCNR